MTTAWPTASPPQPQHLSQHCQHHWYHPKHTHQQQDAEPAQTQLQAAANTAAALNIRSLLCPGNPSTAIPAIPLTAIPLAKRPERADQLLQPPPPWLSRPLRCCCCPLAMLQLLQQSLSRSSAPGHSLCSEACVSDPEPPRKPRPLYSITTHALSHTHVVAHTHTHM